jgi:thiopurine S-methyltransferase
MNEHPAATSAFWRARWAAGQIAFHLATPNPSLLKHWPSLGAGHEVLVPLCGKSNDLAWLAGQGHAVTGVELAAEACAAFFAEHGLEPTVSAEGRFTRWNAGAVTILQGDFFDLDGTFDAVWDRAALIALPPALRERYAAQVRARVRGPMLLVSFLYDGTRRDGPPFPVPDDEVRRLYPDAREIERVTVDEERWNEVGGAEEVVWRT